MNLMEKGLGERQMNNNFIKCIHETELQMLRKGEWRFDKVRVYYALNCYCDDVTHINLIAEYINVKHPDIKRTDMHVHYVTRKESICHANYTTVQIMEDVETVRKNISDYCIL